MLEVGLTPSVVLPDGREFMSWEAQLEFSKTYHVDGSSPAASDDNPGTEGAPFRTINRAAQALQPGERVVVKAGVYRECVRPARGGDGPDKMISYQTEAGADVLIKGSDVLRRGWEPSVGWRGSEGAAVAAAWRIELEPALFDGYNPFAVINLPRLVAQTCFTPQPDLVPKLLARRGLVFQDGRLLRQVHKHADLDAGDGTYWAEPNGQVLHVRPYGDVDPNDVEFEITTREQAFAPKQHELGFVHVQGFTIEQVADGFPWPQRAALSTMRGHHWIIEDNTVRWANALGIDVGKSEADMDLPALCGYHIVRRNRIHDCGVCGIAGTGPLESTLIEENHIDTSDVGGIVTSLRPDPVGQRSAREKAAMERLELNGWQFRGLGIGVNDLDKLVAYYQDLGMGTFQPEAAFDSREIADFKINGEASDTLVKARTQIAQVGTMNYEFVQPLEGDTIYKESVDLRGDGVCNFIFTVADLEAETAKLAEKGVQVLMGGNPKNDGAFAYCDTREVGDMVMKLIQG